MKRKYNMTVEEEMAYYRSRHASARRKTDKEIEELIRFAKFIGHMIFEFVKEQSQKEKRET